jgi:hypothetical protein
MAKKTRKVLKQQSYQRSIQQAQANISAALDEPASATTTTPAAKPAPTTNTAPTARSASFEISAQQEFAYVRSDVRRSLGLAALFSVVMIILSFIVR